jgi:hypothetical protein
MGRHIYPLYACDHVQIHISLCFSLFNNNSFEFRLRIALGALGDLSLTSRIRNTNTDGRPFSYTFAYHTYFSVSDIRYFLVFFLLLCSVCSYLWHFELISAWLLHSFTLIGNSDFFFVTIVHYFSRAMYMYANIFTLLVLELLYLYVVMDANRSNASIPFL